MQIFKNPNYNFVRWRWHALALSLAVIIGGLAMMAKRGGPQLGVEFAGGTVVILKFDRRPDIGQVRQSLHNMPGGGGDDAIVQHYGDPEQNRVMIRVGRVGAESGGALSEAADAVAAAVRQANVANISGPCAAEVTVNCVEGTEIVGPIVGEQLKRQGTLATILALGGILLASRCGSSSVSPSAPWWRRFTTCW
jgi:preprotein translocase subunit SecF